MGLLRSINQNGILIWGLSILLNLVWLILVFSTLTPRELYTYFNSDTLYAASIYRDLFVDGSGLAGWHLNAAPNFFPDLFFYSVFNFLISDFRWAMFIYSLAQYVALLVLLSLTFRKAAPAMDWYFPAIGNILMLLFLFVSLYSGDFSFTFLMLSICYHLGPFLFALLASILLLQHHKRAKKSAFIWLLIVVFLASLSNRLFIVMFVMPSLAALAVFGSHKSLRRNMLKAGVGILISSAAGLLVFTLISLSGYVTIAGADWKMFNFANMANAFQVWLKQLGGFISPLDFRGVVVLLSFVSFFVMLANSVAIIREKVLGKKAGITPQDFYVLFFVLFFPVVLFMPIINGAYVGPAIIRFNIQVYYLGLFNLAFLIYLMAGYLRVQKITGYFGALIILALLILGGVKTSGNLKGLQNLTGYYTDDIRCIDEFARKHGVQYGIAPYWYAKRIMMFSKENVRLYSIYENMRAYYHVMNQNWYYGDGKGAHGNPEFRFVLTTPTTMDAGILKEQLGDPLLVYACPGRIELKLFPEFAFDPANRQPFIKDEEIRRKVMEAMPGTKQPPLDWKNFFPEAQVKNWLIQQTLNNREVMDSLLMVRTKEKDSLEIAGEYVERRFNAKGYQHFEKLMAIEAIIAELNSKPEMMSYLERKAGENQISLEEQIYKDAEWLYKHRRN
jgi:hypothetical protein